MKKTFMLVAGIFALLAGCGTPADKTAGIPINKWKGAPYRLTFEPKDIKPATVGLAIPPIKFTANPEAMESRALLALHFEATGPANKGQLTNRLLGAPVDIRGEEGALPADYVTRASKGLSDYLAGYCVAGNVKVKLALVRSSLNPASGDAELDAKRLSDWMPMELPYKNPRNKCK